jgi:hypothetical protein
MPDDPRTRNITRGMRLTGDAYPADDPRRARIKKGAFLTGGPVPPAVSGAPVYAFATIADAVPVIAARLAAIRQQLDADRTKRK